jgi:fermentation-respiration switch protein FrsA (DUF1100 family)
MRLKLALGAAFAAVALTLGGTWMLQDRLIYFPGGDPGVPPAPWSDLRVASSDGLVLTAWLRPSDAPETRPLVIVFPGNAGNRADRVALGNALGSAGYHVVLAEYRGYGANPGRPSEEGLVADAVATVEAATETVGVCGGLVYFGESLGAAVAVAAAETWQPDAIVLASPFTSLVDVGRHHYPWLPVSALLRDRYPSLERINAGVLDGVPTLVIAGTSDGTVPFGQSTQISAAAEAATYIVEGADHNDPAIRSAPELIDTVARFVDRAILE